MSDAPGALNVLVINYRPRVIPREWPDCKQLVSEYLAIMSSASRGMLNHRIVEILDVPEFPPFAGNLHYDDSSWSEAHKDPGKALRDASGSLLLADYPLILDQFKVLPAVESHQVNEVWLFGGPFFGFYESRVVGKGAFWCNGPALETTGPLFVVMGFNYERNSKEMVHEFGHRAENILARQFDSQGFLQTLYAPNPTPNAPQLSPKNEFERFLLSQGTIHRKPGGEEYSQDELAWVSALPAEWFQRILDLNAGAETDLSQAAAGAKTGSEGNEAQETGEVKEISKSTRAASDFPGGTDRLNFENYAKVFAELVTNPELKTPITIGIFGRWGTGKSFLMGKIIAAIDERTKKPKPAKFFARLSTWLASFLKPRPKPGALPEISVLQISFNAWVYSGSDNLWASLVTNLYRRIENHVGFRARYKRFSSAFNHSLPKASLSLVFFSILGLLLSLLVNYNKIQETWSAARVAVNAVGGSLIGGSVLASLPLLWSTLREFVDALFLSRANKLQQLAAQPDFRAQIGIMDDIKKELHFIRELLVDKRNNRLTRVILFIDDLDRCEFTKVVEVLQAIMLLLADEDSSPFVIFLGIDARVVVKAIEQHYGNVLVKAGINGYEYLEKIIQIPFVIPPSKEEEISKYIESLLYTNDDEKKAILARLNPAGGGQAVDTKNGASRMQGDTRPDAGAPGSDQPVPADPNALQVTFTLEEREALLACARTITDNPRKIKRIINIYQIVRKLMALSPDPPGFNTAIQWILLTEQWPLHSAWIVEAIENDDYQTKKTLEKQDVLAVYDLVKSDIRDMIDNGLAGIDSDTDLFEDFIHDMEPPFSVADIIKLLPFTINLNPAIRSEVASLADRVAHARKLASKKPSARRTRKTANKPAESAAVSRK